MTWPWGPWWRACSCILLAGLTALSARAATIDGGALKMVSARGGAGAAGLPASFAGEIPGAGGAIGWQVDLLPEQRYQLRQTHVGQPAPKRFDDIGRWITGASGRMELRGTRDESLYFEPTSSGLRKLDMQGRRIESAGGHNDLLERLPQPAPIEPRITATGMLRVLADAASITLCADGRRLPVAMQGDYLALERAYAAADKSAPGQALLVSFEGTIAPRKTGEAAQPPRDALVVERFGKVWPRESCGQALADSPLRNTYWKLTRLNGEPATAAARQREPHLILNAKEPRVAGSSGCNRVIGGLELDADKLSFGRMAGTLMACPDGMAQEKALLDALGLVRHWKVRGSHLELSDARRHVLARFEAVALK